MRTAVPGILTILPNGRLFCDSLRTGRELNLTDRDYFRRALDAPAGVVLEAAFGRLTGRAVMQVAYPARDATGALRFVLLASLDLARPLNLTTGVPGGRGGDAGRQRHRAGRVFRRRRRSG